MLNRIILIGRLVRDPELRFTPSGKAVCQFTLAVDRQYADQNGERQADFINIVVWGKAGESCAQYLAKGRLAAVDGRLQIRTYFGQKDGEKRRATEVIAENVRFLSPKDDGSAKEGDQTEQAESAPAYDDGEPWGEANAGEFEGYYSGGLPF